MYSYLFFFLACNEKEVDETDTADVEVEVVEESDCSILELDEIPFSDGPYGNDYGSIAADFTVQTLDGEWNLQDNWSGCDSYLFISHDLSLVKSITSRVLVMRSGEIVEAGNTKEIFNSPTHHYTQNLLESSPNLENSIRNLC